LIFDNYWLLVPMGLIATVGTFPVFFWAL